MYRSSDLVFRTGAYDKELADAFDLMNMCLISSILESFGYSGRRYKNIPYAPSSMFRLFIILNFIYTEKAFYLSRNLKFVSESYLKLCGFTDSAPCYTTYYTFKHRFGFDLLCSFFFTFNISYLKSLISGNLPKLKKTGFVVFTFDSMPVSISGSVPKGIIHSHNKFLDGKLGIRVHHIDIVYPFYSVIAFVFKPANYHDSPIFRNELFKFALPLLTFLVCIGIKVFFDGDKGYDSKDNIYSIISHGGIPNISSRKNSVDVSKFFIQNNQLFCDFSHSKLNSDGREPSKNRHRFECPAKFKQICTQKCSGHIWIYENASLSFSEGFDINRIRTSVTFSPVARTLRKLRSRTETINSHISRWFNFRDVLYFHDLPSLQRFELFLACFSVSFYAHISYASAYKFFHGCYKPKKLYSLRFDGGVLKLYKNS